MKLVIIIIVIIFLIINLINPCICEQVYIADSSIALIKNEAMNNLKESLYEDILNLVKQETFIQVYGKSNVRPELTTLYYQLYVSNKYFIKSFINNLPLENLLESCNYNAHELHMQVREEFVEHFIRIEQELEKEVGTMIEDGIKIKHTFIALTFIAVLCAIVLICMMPPEIMP